MDLKYTGHLPTDIKKFHVGQDDRFILCFYRLIEQDNGKQIPKVISNISEPEHLVLGEWSIFMNNNKEFVIANQSILDDLLILDDFNQRILKKQINLIDETGTIRLNVSDEDYQNYYKKVDDAFKYINSVQQRDINIDPTDFAIMCKENDGNIFKSPKQVEKLEQILNSPYGPPLLEALNGKTHFFKLPWKNKTVVNILYTLTGEIMAIVFRAMPLGREYMDGRAMDFMERLIGGPGREDW